MFCLLFLFWILLNGTITLEIVLLGLVLSAALTGCFCRATGRSPWREVDLLRLLPRAVGYAGYLVGQIIWSNLLVIPVIFGRGKGRPCLTWFELPVERKEGQLVLANSITLTPGTVTVALGERTICVYAIRPDFARGLKSCGFVSRLKKMEGNDRG